MTAQIINSSLVGKEAPRTNWMIRLTLCIVFLTCGLLVFIVFSHYYPFCEGRTDRIDMMVVAGALLALALFSRFTAAFASIG